MSLHIEFDREEDGQSIPESAEWPGALAHGATKEGLASQAEAIALHAVAESIKQSKKPLRSSLPRNPREDSA